MGGQSGEHDFGVDQAEILRLGAGNDTYVPSDFTDVTSVFGNAGNDTFFVDGDTVETIDGGPGFDTATIDQSAGVTDILISIESTMS